MSTSSPTPTVGRVIRAALIILPFGTIVLGALSFVFFFNKKEQTVQRSIRYAAGLRKDLNQADLKHYEQVVSEALTKPQPERAKTMAAFLESTLGPENMGYQVRTLADRGNPQGPAIALDVEVTGSQRPRDLVLVLNGFLPTEAVIGVDLVTPRATAALLGLAHAATGLPKVRSLRFAAVQNIGAVKAYYEEAIQVGERITHVVLLGSLATQPETDIVQALHLEGRGVVVLRPELKGDLLPATQALQKQVNDLAERL